MTKTLKEELEEVSGIPLGRTKYNTEHIETVERARVKRERDYRKHLQHLKDLVDLYGEDAITNPADKVLYTKHFEFFHPGEEE